VEPEKFNPKFDQGEYLKKNPELRKKHPAGVCRSLVCQWLSRGGSLQGSSFQRGGGRSDKVAKSVEKDMDTDRDVLFQQYGLKPIETYSWQPATRGVGWPGLDGLCLFVQVPGFYYVKYGIDGGDGHAIGVVTNTTGTCRVFDPNIEEWIIENATQIHERVGWLWFHYKKMHSFTHLEAVRFEKPSWIPK
jgi:hypothetical protein